MNINYMYTKKIGFKNYFTTSVKGVFTMERVNASEIDRKIEYWRHMLTKTEVNMLKMQSERIEMKQRLAHLQLLQRQAELTA
jgi:hypothetical protein